jgi:NADH:ubiquinone oxidoreductase subunit D
VPEVVGLETALDLDSLYRHTAKVEQMTEHLKVVQEKMDANLKEIKNMKTNQAKAEANQGEMKAKMDSHH